MLAFGDAAACVELTAAVVIKVPGTVILFVGMTIVVFCIVVEAVIDGTTYVLETLEKEVGTPETPLETKVVMSMVEMVDPTFAEAVVVAAWGCPSVT